MLNWNPVKWLKKSGARAPKRQRPRVRPGVEALEGRVVPAGLALDYFAYLGGSGGDGDYRDMASDSAGNIYLAGGTTSHDFPTTTGDRTLEDGWGDVTVMKLNSQGDVIWSTLLGGPGQGDEYPYAISVDSQGFVYVSGRAASQFPTTPGSFSPVYQGPPNTNLGHGENNGFIAKFSPDGAMVWASYLDTSTIVRDLQVDAHGDIYAVGRYRPGLEIAPPPASWFVNGYQKTRPNPAASGVNGEDVYIVKISSDGSRVLAGTWIAGSRKDNGSATLALDAAGNVYFATATESPDMPTANGYDTTFNGAIDMYVAKFTSDLSTLQFGTYFGGTGEEQGETHFMALDPQGNVYLTGGSSSPSLGFAADAYQQGRPGTSNAYVAKISSDGARLLGGTFVGNSAGNFAHGIAVDAQGRAYLVGETLSALHFITPDALASTISGPKDSYLAKVAADFKTVEYGTYIGGRAGDDLRGVHVDPFGNVYTSGGMSAGWWPLKDQPQPLTHGGMDLGLSKFLPTSAPTVTLTAPASGAVVAAGSTVTLQASAADVDGSIAKVEFFANGVLLGAATSGPYRFTWNNVAAGGYFLTAVATDNRGATRVSSAVEVRVTGAVNQAPTIITPALADEMTFTNSRILSVAAADDAGAANLTYTWSVLSRPAGAPVPTFTAAANGTNAARNITATFGRAGLYTFQVVVRDAAGLSATSIVDVTVVQNFNAITLTPTAPSVAVNGAVQFTATAKDQFGQPITQFVPKFGWKVTGGGSIDASGRFTAGSQPGTASVQVQRGRTIVTAKVTVTPATNQAPTVASPAVATPSPVTGATTNLSVLGADDSGEANLIYTWTVQSGPAGVTFTVNNTNGAKNSAAIFTQAGTYSFQVTIRDAGGLQVASSIGNVSVTQTLSALTVTPGAATVQPGATQQFSASAVDQFGRAMAAPGIVWSVNGGTINSATGLFTAGAVPAGPYTVTAASGGVNGTATVTVAGVGLSVNVLPGTSQTIDLRGRKYYTARQGLRGNSGASPIVIGNPVYVGNGGPEASMTWTFQQNGAVVDSGHRWLSATSGHSWSVTLTGDNTPRTVKVYFSISHNNGSLDYRLTAGSTGMTLRKTTRGTTFYEASVTFTGTTTLQFQPVGTLSWAGFALAGIVVE